MLIFEQSQRGCSPVAKHSVALLHETSSVRRLGDIDAASELDAICTQSAQAA